MRRVRVKLNGAAMALWLAAALAARADDRGYDDEHEAGQPAQAADAVRHGRDDGIAVLYPDIGEPYRKVFAEIVEGVQREAHAPVRGYAVADHADIAELQAALKRSGSRVVIALGRQGVKAAGALAAGTPVVVGGVSSVPDADRLNGISLTPDPALLFARLKSLLPGVRRVTVVYNPQNSAALIELARAAARAQGLELVALEAADLAGAVHRYETVFAAADARQDALWLAPDATTVDESTILPLVLKESWSRNVPIFSSSVLHVKKGALFALFPNNLELGRDLADLATALLDGAAPHPGVAPLRAVRTAFNWRTASHIGLSADAELQRKFDFLYPEP